MDESIANKLKLLRDSIEASNYSLDNIREWGGADVIITKDVERIDPDWVKNQPIIISEQEGEPQRRIVVTEHPSPSVQRNYKIQIINLDLQKSTTAEIVVNDKS